MATQNLIQLLASGLRDLDGGVLAGGKVYHYEPGTTTKKAIYEDDLAATESAQPVVLDSRGCAKVYGTGLYDLVVTDSAGSAIESFSTLNAGDAPGSLTAAGLLTLIKTVDGATSGLDADLLDGNHASTFLSTSSYNAADILAKLLTVDGIGSGLDADKLDGVEGSGYATAAQGAKADTALQAADASTILTAIKTVDGTGSGLDADLLDGKHSTAFAAASHAHAMADLSDFNVSTPASGQVLQFDGTDWVNVALSSGAIKAIVTQVGTNPEVVFAGTVAYPCYALEFYTEGWSKFQVYVIQYDSGGTIVSSTYIQNNHVQDHGVWGGEVNRIRLYFDV